jgi:peptide/nickel transport system permease protein
MRGRLHRLRRALTPGGLIGLAIVAAVIGCALAAPLLTPHDPARHDLRARQLPPMWLDGGRPDHPLGTDQLGRDVLSRLIHGARVSVVVGTLGTLVALALGLLLGTLAGYFGRAIDAVISRALDTFMSIPFIILAMAVIAVVGPQRGPGGIALLIAVLGISGWADFARVARAETMATKGLLYVESARALGQGPLRIMLRHVLPNIAAPLIVLGALQVGTVIIAEASLSFLGLGVQPPDVTWGTMLADGRAYVATSWWLATFPGLAITLTVVGGVLLGDWLRDLLDRRTA